MTKFNQVWRKWKPFHEYYRDPWAYFCSFIDILRERNCRFLTMTDAVTGEFCVSDINVVLDHHIDHYPLEMEVMTRWELANDITSNVYLFNRFEQSSAAQPAWAVEDLNIPFYKYLESRGCEIGYHQNVIGSVRYRRTGSRYGQAPDGGYDADFMDEAAQLFREDVENLRRYFDIRTFIPHGGGEDNTAFVTVPEDLHDLAWVYNHAGHRGRNTVRLRWKSFSDSSGPRFQKFRARGATYFLQRDNLHVVGYALQPGLNHILLHPGRYSKGMPYQLASIDPETTPSYCDASYKLGEGLEAPIDVRNLVQGWAAARTERRQLIDAHRPPDDGGKYYLFTDSDKVLLQHMSVSNDCIGFYVKHEDPKGNLASNFLSPRATRDSSMKILPTPVVASEFLDGFERYYNIILSEQIIRYLAKTDLKPKYIHLEGFQIDNANDGDFRDLIRLTRNISKTGQQKLFLRCRFEGALDDDRLKPLRSLEGISVAVVDRMLTIKSSKVA